MMDDDPIASEEDFAFIKRELARAMFVSGQPTRASAGSVDDETFRQQRRDAWDAEKQQLMGQASRILRLIENGGKIAVTRVNAPADAPE